MCRSQGCCVRGNVTVGGYFCDSGLASACASVDASMIGIDVGCWNALFGFYSAGGTMSPGMEQACEGLDPEAEGVHKTIPAACQQAMGIPCAGSGTSDCKSRDFDVGKPGYCSCGLSSSKSCTDLIPRGENCGPVPPPQTTPAPVAAVAPADSKFFVTMTVTMPYKKSDFNEALQDKYKAAIASAAGAPVDNVDIVSITEKRRRAGSVDVETKIRATDESGMTALSDALGSGDALKTKINSALKAQGLPESTGVTAPTKAVIDVSSAGATEGPLWALAVLAAFGAAVF